MENTENAVWDEMDRLLGTDSRLFMDQAKMYFRLTHGEKITKKRKKEIDLMVSKAFPDKPKKDA